MDRITTVGISIHGLTVATNTVVEITVSAPCKITKVTKKANKSLFYLSGENFKTIATYFYVI